MGKGILFILILFGILTGSNAVFSQVGKVQNDTLINYVDINKKKQGKWKKNHKNGKIRYKGQFRNDIPYGVFYYYYSSGKIESILNYDDAGNCKAEIYYENGNTQATGFYDINRKRVKTWNIYYEDGSLAMTINYDNEGKAMGDYVLYYKSTKVKVMECTYKNGKLNGAYKKFFKNGSLQEEGVCEDGLRHGYWKFYTPEAVCDAEGRYVHGKKEGVWKILDKDAQKIVMVNYKNDRSDYDEKKMKEWQDKYEWAKQNQDKFKQPEDFLDNPEDFFK